MERLDISSGLLNSVEDLTLTREFSQLGLRAVELRDVHLWLHCMKRLSSLSAALSDQVYFIEMCMKRNDEGVQG